MNISEILNFVTWHFEVGSALDTRVAACGGGLPAWEGSLAGPRFSVAARLTTRVEQKTLIARAQMEAAPGSRIFDMVLGCRLLCPPGRMSRPGLPDALHAGNCSYMDLPDGRCRISWGEHGSRFAANCAAEDVPAGFAWRPYAADEPDGWRLHARILATGGPGFRRCWIMNREFSKKPIADGAQHVSTENDLPVSFRYFRTADYREYIAKEEATFNATIRIELPNGIVP